MKRYRRLRRYLSLARPGTVAFLVAIIEGRAATGVSSKVMAGHVLGLKVGNRADGLAHAMPYDGGDWGRCVATYLAAPKHLRRRMDPIMSEYHRRLLAYVDAHGNAEWRTKNVCWPLKETTDEHSR